jgi:hypothetical protein
MTASASKVADTAGASKVDADTTAYASKVAGTAVTASNPEVHMPPIPGPDPRQPTTRPMVRVRLPVVRFMPNQRTKNSITMVVSPADADVEGPGGEVIASRCQIPLMLAW